MVKSSGNSGKKKMAGTGEVMIQLFSCCIQQQSPTRRTHHRQRIRIDRSMIGNPTNFVHTGNCLILFVALFDTYRLNYFYYQI